MWDVSVGCFCDPQQVHDLQGAECTQLKTRSCQLHGGLPAEVTQRNTQERICVEFGRGLDVEVLKTPKDVEGKIAAKNNLSVGHIARICMNEQSV